MQKFITEKGKVYFSQNYYILKTVNGKPEVGRYGYDKRKEAIKECDEFSKVLTPKELVAMEDAWESFFECYDIEIRADLTGNFRTGY